MSPVCEIELLCANAEFFGNEKAQEMVNKYETLKDKFQEVRLAAPEDFEFDYLYMECSVTVPLADLADSTRWLAKNGFRIDLMKLRAP